MREIRSHMYIGIHVQGCW